MLDRPFYSSFETHLTLTFISTVEPVKECATDDRNFSLDLTDRYFWTLHLQEEKIRYEENLRQGY